MVISLKIGQSAAKCLKKVYPFISMVTLFQEVHTMGYKKLSQEQELQLVQEYINGTNVNVLMDKYGFKTKK